jgi:drug/metabolite transporter (DMT)-like permease
VAADSVIPAQTHVEVRPSHAKLIAVMGFTVLIWSINYSVAKVGLERGPALAIASFRILFAGLASLPVTIWCSLQSRRETIRGDAARRFKKINRSDLWNFACLGFFGVLMNQGLFTVGLSMTSVGRSAIIVATTPIFILLAAWTQGLEGLTRRKLLGLAVAFAGAVVLGAEPGWNIHSTGAEGDLLTFVACMSVVIFTVLGKRVAKRYDSLQLMAYNVTFAGLLALPIAAWQAVLLTRAGQWSAIGWQGWGSIAYMGGLSSALCIPLYYWVLRWLPPSKVGAMSYLQPVIGTPFAALTLGEPMTGSLLSGGALILAGVYAIESDRSEHE